MGLCGRDVGMTQQSFQLRVANRAKLPKLQRPFSSCTNRATQEAIGTCGRLSDAPFLLCRTVHSERAWESQCARLGCGDRLAVRGVTPECSRSHGAMLEEYQRASLRPEQEQRSPLSSAVSCAFATCWRECAKLFRRSLPNARHGLRPAGAHRRRSKLRLCEQRPATHPTLPGLLRHCWHESVLKLRPRLEVRNPELDYLNPGYHRALRERISRSTGPCSA